MKHIHKILKWATLAITFISIPLKASHIFGGEISATAVNCQSYTYDIVIRLFEHTGSDTDLISGEFYVGYGDPISIETVDYQSESLQIDGTHFMQATISHEHTFPGPGSYTLYFKEFARDGEIVNMNRAEDMPLYIESRVFIDPVIGCNGLATFNMPPRPLAFANTTYLDTLSVTENEGDSLSYALIVPQQDVDTEVEFYTFPQEFDKRYAPEASTADGRQPSSLSLSTDGILRWDAPYLEGIYSLAIKVTEWRKVDEDWLNIGHTVRDYNISVLDTVHHRQAQDYYITAAQEEEVKKPKIGLYPNPTPGTFTLEINEDRWRGGSLSIYSLLGKEILQQPIQLGSNEYDIASASQGVYFLTLRNGDQKKTIRFMKQ